MTADVCILYTTTGLSNPLTKCTYSKHQHSLPFQPAALSRSLNGFVKFPAGQYLCWSIWGKLKGMKETKEMMIPAQKCPPSLFKSVVYSSSLKNRINQRNSAEICWSLIIHLIMNGWITALLWGHFHSHISTSSKKNTKVTLLRFGTLFSPVVLQNELRC